MASLFSSPPKPQGPDPELIALQKKQLEQQTAKTTKDLADADEAQSFEEQQRAAGMRGYRSLISGDYTGYTLGGSSSLGGG